MRFSPLFQIKTFNIHFNFFFFERPLLFKKKKRKYFSGFRIEVGKSNILPVSFIPTTTTRTNNNNARNIVLPRNFAVVFEIKFKTNTCYQIELPTLLSTFQTVSYCARIFLVPRLAKNLFV